MKYNKLVRDKIPEIIEASGKKPNYRIITDEKEFIHLLCEKLIEEANELKEAIINNGDYLEELADVLTVFNSIVDNFLTKKEYNSYQSKYILKSITKGDFKNHIFLESVDDE